MSREYPRPFFVYVTWRYSYSFQKRENEVVLWYEGDELNDSPMRKVRFLVHQLHMLDLPIINGLKIDSLPSLIYID